MRVLLINPPNTYRYGDDFAVTFPLGLAYLAATLEANGHEPIVLDALAGYDAPTVALDGLYHCGMTEEEIVADVLRHDPDLIGLTCAYTVQFPTTRSLARAIKRATDTPIVIGGAHASALPDETLAEDCFDFVAIGEGEVPLVGLCSHLERGTSLEGVSGIAYRDSARLATINDKKPLANVNTVPVPARHLFDMSKYIYSEYSHNGSTMRMPYATMISSRGCPLRCSFCSVHTIWGRNNRTRGPKETVDEIEHLVDTYGVKEIHFEDDMLIMDRKRMIAICNEIVNRKLDITWTTPNGVYVNALNEELLVAMKASGCYQLALAVESGSRSVLRLMNKNVRLEYAREIISIMRKLEMGVYFFFIIGMPGETEKDIIQTVEYAKELRPDEAYFSIATPYPGTPLYDQCRERGYIPEDYDPTMMRTTQPLIETEHLSRADIGRLRDYAYQEWESVKPPPWYKAYESDLNTSRKGGIYTIGVGHQAG